MKQKADVTLIGFNYVCIIAVPIIVSQCSARFMVYTTCCCSAQNTSFSHDGQNRLRSGNNNQWQIAMKQPQRLRTIVVLAVLLPLSGLLSLSLCSLCLS